MEHWKARDPLDLAGAELSSASDAEWVQEQRGEIATEIENAFQRAREAPFITLDECRELVYA